MNALAVFMGAGFGGLARYTLGGWVQSGAGNAFPWGTLFVNVTGSLLLTFLVGGLDRSPNAAEWRLFLGVGLCGGYTTFSAFSYETIRLMQAGDWQRAASYVGASVLLCAAAAYLGFELASAIRAG
jgi:CrcB protein